jgi:hypothetical protein
MRIAPVGLPSSSLAIPSSEDLWANVGIVREELK